jgi:hypothetical protein
MRELAEASVQLHCLDEASPARLAAAQVSTKGGCTLRLELTVGEADQIVAWAHGL